MGQDLCRFTSVCVLCIIHDVTVHCSTVAFVFLSSLILADRVDSQYISPLPQVTVQREGLCFVAGIPSFLSSQSCGDDFKPVISYVDSQVTLCHRWRWGIHTLFVWFLLFLLWEKTHSKEVIPSHSFSSRWDERHIIHHQPTTEPSCSGHCINTDIKQDTPAKQLILLQTLIR